MINSYKYNINFVNESPLLNNKKKPFFKKSKYHYQLYRTFFNNTSADVNIIRLLFIIFILVFVVILLSFGGKNLRDTFTYCRFLNAMAPLLFPFFKLVFIAFALDNLNECLNYLTFLPYIVAYNWLFVHTFYPLLKKFSWVKNFIDNFLIRMGFLFILALLLKIKIKCTNFDIFFFINTLFFYISAVKCYFLGESRQMSEFKSSFVYNILSLLTAIFDHIIIDKRFHIHKKVLSDLKETVLKITRLHQSEVGFKLFFFTFFFFIGILCARFYDIFV